MGRQKHLRSLDECVGIASRGPRRASQPHPIATSITKARISPRFIYWRTQSQNFELPEDAETIKVKLRGVTILGSGGVMTGIVARLALPRVWREAEMEGR